MLIPSISQSLEELKILLRQLSDQEYIAQCPELSNATIGEHTRHIVEMFQCLTDSYDCGVVNYDKRKRDPLIQNHTAIAIEAISAQIERLDLRDKDIELQQVIDGEEIRIKTNYFRELLYNLEHCIHHQALIKVAILKCAHIAVNENFGVARSTIEYRNQCVQ